MHRSHKTHSSSSSSFTKFVARLQHKFSSKNIKSSTVIVPQQTHPRISTLLNHFQLSEILYDPSRPIEYISEIKDKDDSNCYSTSSFNSTTISEDDQYNLSQMNISYDYRSPQKRMKLSKPSNTVRLHSTAIHDITQI